MNRYQSARVVVVQGLFLVCLAIGLFPAVVASQEQHAPVDPKILKELSEIRARLGGGVAEQLKGIDTSETWKETAKRAYEEEIRRLAAGQASSLKASTRPAETPLLQPIKANPQPEKRWTQDSGDASNSPASPNRGLSQDRICHLRNAARHLEEMAANFELQGMYQEADEIREQAHRFWHKARGQAR